MFAPSSTHIQNVTQMSSYRNNFERLSKKPWLANKYIDSVRAKHPVQAFLAERLSLELTSGFVIRVQAALDVIQWVPDVNTGIRYRITWEK